MRYYGETTEEGTKEEIKEETVSETSSDSASGNTVDVANAEKGEDQTATALSTGTIALIGIGSVVFIALIVLLILNSRKKKKGNL